MNNKLVRLILKYFQNDSSLHQKESVDLIYSNNMFPKCLEKPHEIIDEIIEHPLFQRLDRINQLSLKKPNITRSSHSKGTRAMASIYIKILNDNSAEEERINPIQSLAIQTAALLHDIGHGPFSHLFEQILKSNKITWKHEDQSVLIVKHIFKEMDLIRKYNLPSDFLDAVCDMIAGISKEDHKIKYSESAFKKYSIFTIVNGDYESSLDVDKFDYMRRDSFFTCSPKYFNQVSNSIKNIMLNSKIQNDRIVYLTKAARDLVLFANMVYMNYRYVYFDPKDVGIELLFYDILKNSDIIKSINEYIDDLDKFSIFDDEFLMKKLNSESNEELKKHLLRFRENDGYLMVGCVDIEYKDNLNPNVEQLISRSEDRLKGANVESKDYAIVVKTIGRVVKRKTGKWNILETVEFYDKENIDDNLFYNHLNYLEKQHSDAKMLSSSFEKLSENPDFQAGTIQLRFYSKTTDQIKIAKMKKILGTIMDDPIHN